MIVSIQSLRGIAVLLVVYYHAHGLIIKRHEELGLSHQFWMSEQGLTKFGAIGVDIFFVISGFIIFHATWSKRITGWDFIKKRITRIYPIYWVATLFFVLISFLPGSSAALDIRTIFASLLLFPTFSDGQAKPVLEVGWSLYYEMFFYAIFSLLIWQSRTRILIQVTCILAALVVLGRLVHFDVAFWTVVTNERLLEFVAGGWLAYVVHSGVRIWSPRVRWGCIFLIVTGTALFVFADEWREEYSALITRGPVACAIFSIFLFDKNLQRYVSGKWMQFLGDASYSIYLFHMFPFFVASALWKRGLVVSPFDPVTTWSLLTVIGVASGIFAYLLIERPLTSFLKQRMPAYPDSRSNASP